MLIQKQSQEKARLTHDPRFDGSFYIGVKTTGIYCRPICPARTPKSENVQFFTFAAGAEYAGFRPCLRCRPEFAPGSPALRRTSPFSNVLKLLDRNATQRGIIRRLPALLETDAYTLSLEFLENTGASPVDFVQTLRLQFAKRLLLETALTPATVARASGFKNRSELDGLLNALFGRETNGFRKDSFRPSRPAPGFDFVFRLFFRPPFDWHSLLEFKRMRASAGVEMVGDGFYRRTIAIGEKQGRILVCPTPGRNCLELHVAFPDPTALYEILGRVRRMFDLHAFPLEIEQELLSQDQSLGGLLKAYPGLRIPGAWDGFEVTVRAILGQQVSVKGATTLAGRLVRDFGAKLDSGGEEPNFIFPTAHDLVDAGAKIKGMPTNRARAIQNLAEAVAGGAVSFDAIGDPMAFVRELTKLRGIGDWTAEYAALRGLGASDAFPTQDLGIRRAMAMLLGCETDAEVVRQSEVWRPWRAYAALYLWKGYAARML